MDRPTSFSTYLLNHEPMSRAVARFAAAGVKALELFGGEYTHWHPGDEAQDLKGVLASHGVRVTSVHLPKEELVHAAQFEIEGAIERLAEALSFGSSLGATSAVLHAGIFQPGDLGATRRRLVDAVKQVCAAAEKKGVVVLVENLPKFDREVYFGRPVADLVWLCEESNSPNIGICFDTGHSYVNGFDVLDEVNTGAEWIRSIHISDNHGFNHETPRASDEHLPAGEGSIDWAAFSTCLEELSLTSVEMIHEPASKTGVEEEETIRRCLNGTQPYWRVA